MFKKKRTKELLKDTQPKVTELSPKSLLTELFGWYGVAAYIVSYGLVSAHILKVDDFLYQFMNFSGAVGLLVISLLKKAHQPAVSNLLWAIIALFALGNIVYSNFR